jgi:hypothetical protein
MGKSNDGGSQQGDQEQQNTEGQTQQGTTEGMAGQDPEAAERQRREFGPQ